MGAFRAAFKMMLKSASGAGFAALLGLSLNACTGTQNEIIGSAGNIRITPGSTLTIDLQDIVAIGQSNFNLSLKTVADDYRSMSEFYDLTAPALATLAEGKTSFSFTIPKNFGVSPPFVIVADLPEIQDYLMDVIQLGQSTARPGIAGRLAFDLVDSYYTPFTPKKLAQYSTADFTGIKGLIQSRVNQLASQSEFLSLGSLPYEKTMRFYRNALTFNPAFLTAVRAFGVDFDFTRTPVPGVTVDRTPENDLSSCQRGFCYEYARSFRVRKPDGSSEVALNAPFRHNSNNPAVIAPGAQPGPSANLFVGERIWEEGSAPAIRIRARTFDLEQDHVERVFLVKYTPRRLPPSRTSLPGFPFVGEPQAEPLTPILLGSPDTEDMYAKESIRYNEALDKQAFPDCVADPTLCDTAYREIYYLVTDGMAWVPYQWKFAYSDSNRSPRFIRDAAGNINDTHFDSALQQVFNDPAVPGVSGWKQHNSHCENDPDATSPVDCVGGPSVCPDVKNYYTRITSKEQGPWSCAFRFYDPDLRDDPNGAPDQFHVEVAADPFSMIQAGGLLDATNSIVNMSLAWPPVPPTFTPEAPARVAASTVFQNCGPDYGPCAVAISQVEIDNAVKNAAESQANQSFGYQIRVVDRAVNGLSETQAISRVAQFLPNPPLMVNYSTATPAPGSLGAQPRSGIVLDPTSGNKPVYVRTETFFDEIKEALRPFNNSASHDSLGLPSALLSAANRAKFSPNDLNGNPVPMSAVMTQPHTLCDSASPTDNGTRCRGAFDVTFNGLNALTGSAGFPVLLGTSLRMLDAPLFDFPHAYDSVCSLPENNFGVNPSTNALIWDQRPAGFGYLNGWSGLPGGTLPNPRSDPGFGGWTFEINAVDYDNLNLRSGEPSDPVYFSASVDPTMSGRILFCDPVPPNTDSRYGETYANTKTPPAASNAKDPDVCASWSATPPTKMQPIPVYYEGKTATGTSTIRKWVYHRLRIAIRPTDQGRESNLGEQDPPGIIRNFLRNVRLNGNVFLYKSDTRDRTEPFDPVTFVRFPLAIHSTRHEMKSCLTGQGGGLWSGSLHALLDTNNTQSLGRVFSVLDADQVHGGDSSRDGFLTGNIEVDMRLAGSRNLLDPELLKFIPYFQDCTTRNDAIPSKAALTYRWSPVAGASGYSVKYRQVQASPGTWTSVGPLTGTNFTLSGASAPNAYETYEFQNDATTSSGLVSSPIVKLQANPTPPPAPAATPSLPPAIWYSSTTDGTNSVTDGANPQIRMSSDLGSSGTASPPSFCVRSFGLPVTDLGQRPYSSVWIIRRANPADNQTRVLESNFLKSCTGYGRIEMKPYQQLLAVAALSADPTANAFAPQTCAVPLDTPFTIDGNTSLVAMAKFRIDPASPTFGALNPAPSPANYRLDWFPSIYGKATPSPPNLNATNGYYFLLNPLNSFQLDLDTSSPTFGRTTHVWAKNGVGSSLTMAPAVNLGSAPVTPGNGFHLGATMTHLDLQPVRLGLLTPAAAPSTNPAVWYRLLNSGTLLQAFSYAPATGAKNITLGVTTFDQAVTSRTESDPYDIYQYSIAAGNPANTTAPVNAPVLSGISPRTGGCTAKPINYPTDLSLLRMDNLAPYRACSFDWTQAPGDAGSIYRYTLNVQDNWGAVPSPLSAGVGGVGSRNGPLFPFRVELYSLETNKKPYFVDASNQTLSSVYPSGAGWSAVFPSGTPAISPQCVSGSTGGCTPLSISADDVLSSDTPVPLTEVSNPAAKTTISVTAKDDANQTSLKTLNAIRPTSVYLVGGSLKGQTIQVRSFTDVNRFSFIAAANSVGTLSVQIQWAPSDWDAYFLSNSDGFLIPIVVRDTQWDPSGGETGFPQEFKVPALSRTIWVWAKLSVLNQTPELTYWDGAQWRTLMGATLQFQTGSNSPIRIRAMDADAARFANDNTERTLSFFQSSDSTAADYFFKDNPSFLGFQNITALPAANPALATITSVTQEFQLTASPNNSNIGIPYTAQIIVKDPGDPSRGLALNETPAANPPFPRAQVAHFPVSFSINVVGRPIFLAPAPTPPSPATGTRAQAFSFFNNEFYYPLSLSVSRPSEKTAANSTKNFFMGVMVKGTPTPPSGTLPVAFPASATDGGFFVNENYVLRARPSTFTTLASAPAVRRYMTNVDQSRVLMVGAIAQGRCNTPATNNTNYINSTSINTTTTYPITLVRINETTNQLQYCNLTSTNATADLSLVELQHTLKGNVSVTPPNPIQTASAERITTAPLSDLAALNREWQDFNGRCGGVYCASTNGGSGIGTNGDGTLASAIEGGERSFTGNSYQATFRIHSGVAKKRFVDTNPSAASRKLDITALKGETLTFGVNLQNTIDTNLPPLQARWYVNGCLRKVELVTQQALAFDLEIPATGSGLNNDCSGQFDRGTINTTESSDSLGFLRVRVAVVRGFENTLLNTEEGAQVVNGQASGSVYAFNVRVVNNNPLAQLQDQTIGPRSFRVRLDNVNSPVPPRIAQFFTAGSNRYVAYTDVVGSAGLIRIRSLTRTGGLDSHAVDLQCPGFNSSPVQWLGVDPGSTTVSIGMSNTYATKGSRLDAPLFPVEGSSVYTDPAKTCVRNNLTITGTSSVTATAASNGGDAVRLVTTSPLVISPRVSATYTSGSSRFLFDGVNSSFSPWSTLPYTQNASLLYPTTTPALFTNYANNTVVRNIVAGNRVIQLVGAVDSKSNPYRSGLIVSSLATNGNGGLTGTPTEYDLISLCGASHAVTAHPVDGAYIPDGIEAGADTLFILMTDLAASSGVGRLFEIRKLTTSPVCRLVSANLMLPSRFRDIHNPMMRKMVVDTHNGLLWGIITRQDGQPGMVFSYDYISQREVKFQTLSFTPLSLIHFSGVSNGANSIHIMNAVDKSLYRIW
jgi:hypothetical protein